MNTILLCGAIVFYAAVFGGGLWCLLIAGARSDDQAEKEYEQLTRERRAAHRLASSPMTKTA